MDIKGLNFIRTCDACPEQYDVYDKNKNLVGYVRLRHGYLYAEYPDVGGEMVYEAYPEGDGIFKNDDERKYHLNKIAKCLLEKMAKNLLDNEDNKENEENVF